MTTRACPPGGFAGGDALPNRGVHTAFAGNMGVGVDDAHNGFTPVDPAGLDVPPKETSIGIFGDDTKIKVPNWERMTTDPATGKSVDKYCGGFVNRFTNGSDRN